MKYLTRAVKYFLQVTIFFAVVLWILACMTSKSLIYKPEDLSATLVHGWNSVWLILGVFAAVSAIYPMLGYMRRPLETGGSIEELKSDIDDFMLGRGYVFEKADEESLCYRYNGGMGRIARLWEDRITIRQGAAGLEMEGLRKDVARLSNGLEIRFGGGSSEE